MADVWRAIQGRAGMKQELEKRYSIHLAKTCVIVSLFAMLCFVVLPSLANLAPVKARMELNNAKRIDGGATFYTDLPFLEELLSQRESN